MDTSPYPVFWNLLAPALRLQLHRLDISPLLGEESLCKEASFLNIIGMQAAWCLEITTLHMHHLLFCACDFQVDLEHVMY